jgi:hypothetical protein
MYWFLALIALLHHCKSLNTCRTLRCIHVVFTLAQASVGFRVGNGCGVLRLCERGGSDAYATYRWVFLPICSPYHPHRHSFRPERHR